MPGRFTQFAIRSLDQLALLLRLSPGAKLPAHLQTGRRGEEEAYFHLRELGYQMVARNYRSPRRRGDLDLIGWEKETLCFIEVKTRTTREVKPAEAAVDGDKREQLKAMAREYLRSFDKVPAFRFDLVTIYFLGQKPEITLFKNFMGMP
ncbi:MAG TPA: YraN family protein [Terriglobales bacterium]